MSDYSLRNIGEWEDSLLNPPEPVEYEREKPDYCDPEDDGEINRYMEALDTRMKMFLKMGERANA